MLFLPILIFPLLSVGMSAFSENSNGSLKIAIHEKEHLNAIINNYLLGATEIEVIYSDNPIELLRNNEVDCIIECNNNKIAFIYNSSSFRSLSSATRLGENVERFIGSNEWSENLIACVLEDENGNTNESTRAVNALIAPSAFLLLLFHANAAISNDMFAGEKERKTMELIMVSGVTRKSFYYGKICVILLASCANAIVCTVSFFFSINTRETLSSNRLLAVTNLLICVVCIITISSVASSTISLRSKNMRNAQIANDILSLIPMLLAVLLVIGEVPSMKEWYSLIPVFNVISCFYNTLMGECTIKQSMISLVITMCVVLCVVRSNEKYVNSERLIIG